MADDARRASRLTGLLGVAFATVVAFAGGGIVFSESENFAFRGAGWEQIVAWGSNGPAGVSTYVQQDLLQQCLDAMASLGSPQFDGVPAETQAAIPTNCEHLADNILARAPTHSLAALTGAAAAASLGDWAGMNSHLVQSQLVGPAEQWIAEWRVNLSEQNLGRLDEAALEAHTRDLTMLTLSMKGSSSIASRYVAVPEFRERITAILETASPTAQRRFLNFVKRIVSTT